MALDFREKFKEAREIFDRASATLSLDLESICRDENDPRLDLTEFTQPCILTAEIAMLESLRAHFDFQPTYFGGHSLGEYTALVAAGAIPFEAAVTLVHARGKLMQWSIQPGAGAMAAVIMEGLAHDEISRLAAEAGVDIANDNSMNQVVLSGEQSRMQKLCDELQARYTQESARIVPLTVSAPFHSRHMIEIEGEFGKILETHQESFHAAKATSVTSNWTGTFHTGSTDDLIQALTRQISGRVRWRDNMEALRSRAATLFELGPNRPLSAFFKTLGVPVQAIIDVRTAQRALPQAAQTQKIAETVLH
jgi:[acyl-carrier-protein] S-malonyltransferase/trans-AT polyketide synthase/acyltransferase/oxidoreductase domain-containing protein